MSEVLLPSGLRGIIRELGIPEENMLSDKKLAKSGKSLHKVLQSCWVETLDPGIYDFGGGAFDVLKLLQGDGLVLLVKLRIESYGPEFLFDVNCPRCGHKIPWELDLNEYLEKYTKILPETSKEILLNKNGIFEMGLPKCGKTVHYRLLTLKDELQFPELRRNAFDKMSSTLLNLVIKEIDGIKMKRLFLGLDPFPEKWEGPKEILSSSDASFFRDAKEDIDCGLMTQFEIECIDDGEVAVELPFHDNFLLPKTRGRSQTA